MFRRYLKKGALEPDVHQTIHAQSFTDQGLLFACALKLPAKFYKKRCQIQLMMMISSHRILWRKRMLPNVRAYIGPQRLAELQPLFWDFFNQPKDYLRLRFFKEPLIQELWPRFITKWHD